MTLWLLLIVLCSATAVVISIPLIRRYDDNVLARQDQAIYHNQMSEVDRDQTAGAIDATEAVAARAEIRRRLNASEITSNTARPISPGWKMFALASTAGLIILGGAGLYGNLGSPELSPVSAAQTSKDQGIDTAQVEGMIEKLKARLKASPKDAEGWRTLGWAQFNTQRYAEAAESYSRALEIEPANTDYKSAYAESLVQAAEGVVTPKAQSLVAEVLAKDPKDFRARFYDALALEQAGDQSGALNRWTALLADAPADANWREVVKQHVINLGKTTGRDVAAVASGNAAGAAAPQISDEQKAAIQALPADDQQAMIKGMVAKLAEKLKANPNDPDGWIRLIRSYQVLNDSAAAKDALAQALTVFTNDPANKSKVIAAAAELGVN